MYLPLPARSGISMAPLAAIYGTSVSRTTHLHMRKLVVALIPASADLISRGYLKPNKTRIPRVFLSSEMKSFLTPTVLLAFVIFFGVYCFDDLDDVSIEARESKSHSVWNFCAVWKCEKIVWKINYNNFFNTVWGISLTFRRSLSRSWCVFLRGVSRSRRV